MAVVITQNLTGGQAVAAYNDKWIIFNSDTLAKNPVKAQIDIEKITSSETKSFVISPDASGRFIFNVKEAIKSFFDISVLDSFTYLTDNVDQEELVYLKFNFTLTITQDDDSTEVENVNDITFLRSKSSFSESSFLFLNNEDFLIEADKPKMFLGYPLSVCQFLSSTNTIVRRLLSDGESTFNSELYRDPVDKNGLLLKWRNKKGGFSYWLFNPIVSEDIRISSEGSFKKTITNDYLNEIGSEIELGKESTFQITLNTRSEDLKETQTLRSIIGSSEVYIYTKRRYSTASDTDWLKCDIVNTNLTSSNKYAPQNFRLTIQLPEEVDSNFVYDKLLNICELVEIDPLAAPTNFNASPFSENAIYLSWTDNSNQELGYEIWRSTTGIDDFVRIAQVFDASEFTDSDGLQPATTYYYRIRAFSDNNTSDFSPIDSATTFNAFVSTWDTTQPGSSGSNEITLPLISSGEYSMIVAWGDGVREIISSYNQPEVTHIYDSPGVYEVKIYGTVKGWQFNNSGDRLKLSTISKWGTFQPTSVNGIFSGCNNLNITATDIIDLSQTNTLNNFFRNCTSLSFNSSIASWDVSGITDISSMFFNCDSFNQNINSWDVTSVINCQEMFQNCAIYNQPHDNWVLSSCTTIISMFGNCPSFNGALDGMDVSNVRFFQGALSSCNVFNQPLNSWDVSNANNFTSLFNNSPRFNQNLNSWNVSNVTTFFATFQGCTDFNGDISSWIPSSATGLQSMFKSASSFNQNINGWGTHITNVSSCTSMFEGASSYNQPMNTWDVSNLVGMAFMFSGTTSFNQDITGWNTSSATTFSNMFNNSAFNRNIGSWNISSLNTAQGMFANNFALSTANLDGILNGWAAQVPTIQNNVVFDAASTARSSASDAAVTTLTGSPYNWTINTL